MREIIIDGVQSTALTSGKVASPEPKMLSVGVHTN